MDLRRLKDTATGHFKRGRFAKAAESYAELCRREPREAQHRIKLGDSYRRDGKRDQAIDAYRQASRAYAEQGVIIKAIAACKLVLELDPEHHEAQEELANLCTRRYVRSSPSSSGRSPFPPASNPAVASPAAAPTQTVEAIELPEDDGEAPQIVTAGGAILETEIGAPQARATRAVVPPAPEAFSAGSIPRVSPHGGGDGIDLDVASEPRESPAPATARFSLPAWAHQATALGSDVIELEELQETASPPSTSSHPDEQDGAAESSGGADGSVFIPAPPERRRGPGFDLSAWSEPSFRADSASPVAPPSAQDGESALADADILEPVDAEELEPLEIVELDEIGAEILPPDSPRVTDDPGSDDLALEAAAQSVADMLSNSLLVDGESDDGYEVELLSVTAADPEWAEKSPTPPPARTAPDTSGPSFDFDPSVEPIPSSHSAASDSETAAPIETGSASFEGIELDTEAGHAATASQPPPTPPPAPPSDSGVASQPAPTAAPGKQGPVVIRPAASSRPEDSAQALVPDFSGTALDLLRSQQLANEAFEASDLLEDSEHATAAADVDQSSVPLFSELPRDAFLELLQRLTFQRHEPGDVVIREGDSGRSIFVLASGRLRVVKDLAGPDEMELAILEEGSFFGEMALLNGTPRVASVVAVDEVETLEITEALLQELVSRYAPVARSLRKFYRQRLLSNVMAISPIFRSLSRRDRRALLERFKLREVSAGHVVCKEGEENDGLYVVMHGRLQVSRTREDGNSVTLAVLREGDIFGESSLLARSSANATVTSTRKTLMLRLPRDSFNELISTHPMVLEVLSMLADGREQETEAILSGNRPPPDESAA